MFWSRHIYYSFGNLSHNHLILSLAFSEIYFINYFFAICKALVHFMYNILWLQSSSPHFLFLITPCIIVLLTRTQFITYCLQPPALSLRCHCQFSISLFYNCAFNYSSLLSHITYLHWISFYWFHPCSLMSSN